MSAEPSAPADANDPYRLYCLAYARVRSGGVLEPRETARTLEGAIAIAVGVADGKADTKPRTQVDFRAELRRLVHW